MKENKSKNKENNRSKNITIRFSPHEHKTIKEKAKAVGTTFSNYSREMVIYGFVKERTSIYDFNEIRLLRQLLIEYRTNFSRISNLISVSNPGLNEEIREVKNKIEITLNTYKL